MQITAFFKSYKLDNIIEYSKMKNGRQWRPNCLEAIILNYYLLKMKMN